MNYKLFHGLAGTNQGIHESQPGTVLSMGSPTNPARLLSIGHRTTRLIATVAVKRELTLLNTRAPTRILRAFHDQG